MADIRQILEAARSILLVDWPSRDVPETLTRAGYRVVVKGGPGADQYSAYELRNGEVTVRDLGRPPMHADLVYAHRPLDRRDCRHGQSPRGEDRLVPVRPGEDRIS